MKNILHICFLLLVLSCSNPSENKQKKNIEYSAEKQKEHIEGSEEEPIKKRVYYKDFDLLTFQGKNKIESLDSLEKYPFLFSFSYLQDSLENISIYSNQTVIQELKYKKSDNVTFVYFEDDTYREMYGPNCVSYIYAKNDSIIKLYYNYPDESDLASLISIDVVCKGVEQWFIPFRLL